MTPRRRAFLHLALGSLAALAPAGDGAALHWRERLLHGLGSTLRLRAGHARAVVADAGLDAAVVALRRVERRMSLFDPASALSTLNRDGVLHGPHPQLVEVLRLAADLAARSDGAFDITVLPLWQAWHRARLAGRAPADAELRRAREAVDWRSVEVADDRIRLLRPRMAITLNGIAQGFAADRARDAMRAHGIEHALLDTGEWAPLGRAPDGRPWRLGLESPQPVPGAGAHAMLAVVRADGRAIATSSDAHDAFSSDRRHHHIFDPRRGESPTGLASVSVLAPSAALADGLAKVLFMDSADAALALARKWGVDALVVDKQGRMRASAGIDLG